MSHTFNLSEHQRNLLTPIRYPNWFTPDQCDQIIALMPSLQQVDGSVVRSADSMEVDTSVRRVRVGYVTSDTPSYRENKWIFDRLEEAVKDANQWFFRFNLTGFMEGLQLLRYDEPNPDANLIGGFYRWHTDTGHGNLCQRKLTCIVQLTDPAEYTGCRVEVMGFGEVPVERGSLIVFPSFTHHQVTELVSGQRHCLVGWVSGEPFR